MSDSFSLTSQLGFNGNPFAVYDANFETRLAEYFVPPPYFQEAFGDPDFPQSFFVFAPRGGGKSAQRIMMENKCSEKNILALTYDNFDVFDVRQASEVRLEDHIRRILCIGYLGILVSIYDDSNKLSGLSNSDRSMLATMTKLHVANLTPPELRSTLNSLTSITAKAKEAISSHGLGFELDASAISEHFLKFKLGITATPVSPLVPRFDSKYELELLISFARKVEYNSVYVLVDKVDECELTGNNAIESFKLIEPLVKSLSILQTVGVGFKFFLWDALSVHFTSVARPDRVGYRTLEWKRSELTEMLRKRLIAFSEGRIRKLDSISKRLPSLSLDDIAVVFADRSPRDIIRLCGKIVAEQEQLNENALLLEEDSIYQGIDTFCEMRVKELFEAKYVAQFRAIGTASNQIDFTINYLSNYVFKEKKDNAIRGNIKKWRDDGYIINLGTILLKSSRTGRPVKLYGIQDVRLAKFTSGLSPEQFLQSKVRLCRNCDNIVLRDWDETDSKPICHTCGYNWKTGEVPIDFVPLWDYDLDEGTNEDAPAQLGFWPK